MSDPLGEPRTFVSVYRLPEKLVDGYCFGGGVPITFLNVDWFEAPIAEGRDALTAFIQGKRYFRPDARYLVLANDPTLTYVIEPPNVVQLEDRR